jgi:chorismate dehydratase
MRLGAVRFLNAYPLYWGLKYEPGVEIKKDIPSRLADDLFRHELDLAIISSIEYHRHRDIFKYYPDLCISASGRVESIRLYLGESAGSARHLIEDATKWLGGQTRLRIYYDVATRSSLSMLKVLLNEHCPKACAGNGLEFVQIAPPFEKLIGELGENEMVLLIGDSALRLKDLPSIDMGEFYFKTFQRAFVYAVWVYRPETGGQARDILLNAYDVGQKNLDEMIKDAVAEFKFSGQFTRDYITRIVQYQFTDTLKDDMNFFFEKFDAADL